jgi:Flp pilus assembly protein TadD
MKIHAGAFVCLLGLSATTSLHAQMTYHAKIAVEGGTPLPSAPQIRVGMSERLMPACIIFNVFGNGNVEYAPDWRFRTYDPNTADHCPVTIRLTGYRTTDAVLRDGATIILKRLGDHEGSTVAITSLKAPEDARKAYEKGVAALTRNKFSEARKSLERAVELYPEYAQAWSDLGEVRRQEGKLTEARDAYERASQVDPKYIRPYVQLARLALAEGRNQEALGLAERGLALRPVAVPAIYYYHAVASYNLKQYDVAGKSASQAIESDQAREIPRAEYLLGLALAAKGDRAGALQHMRKYIEIAPKATDIGEVKQQIDRLETSTQN